MIKERPWMIHLSINTSNKEEKETTNLIPRGLKLIGIRFYPCKEKSEEKIKKAKNIQKNLYGHDWLYFNKGFKIVESNDSGQDISHISHIEVNENAFDSNFLLYSHPSEVSIGFNAIIGQNGTGKSTIVDTIIRLINNLSAAIIGEDYVYSSAQHLHYIDNVYASLAVYIKDKIKVLTCLGDKLYISTYKINIPQSNQTYNNSQSGLPVIERYKFASSQVILTGEESKDELLKAQNNFRSVLNEWFYTLVGNYSLYAYNYRDYSSERTCDDKLIKLREIRPTDKRKEDEYWLKGVFHKNDGYQTPVVIHPMRNQGYVNAATVNYLGKQNLISLAFVKSKDSDKFPFRIINNTHHIVGFKFSPCEATYNKSAVEGIMSEKLDLDDKQKEKYHSLEEPIKKFWANAIGIHYTHSHNESGAREAWNYLVYKTVKIFLNYKHYENAFESIKSDNALDKLESHLNELIVDSSHRTQKLRQVLTYLRFLEDKGHYLNQSHVVDIDEIYNWMKTKEGQYLYPEKAYHPITIEDLLPPPYPIMNTELQLVDDEHYDEYKEKKNQSVNIIPFEGLSSGERQIAYSLGNIIYHLKNIDSAMDDLNSDPNHIKSLKYNYVNIMLDEVELYFHPDLQRRFVSLLLDAMRSLNLKGIEGINVTLITHSPFVLSDIPSENILSLSRSKDEVMKGNTFAANIHDLFNNTFILPYTIGELAKQEIEKIVSIYNDRKNYNYKYNKNGRLGIMEANLELNNRDWAKMRYIANIIGDDYLHGEINDMLNELEEYRHNEES